MKSKKRMKILKTKEKTNPKIKRQVQKIRKKQAKKMKNQMMI